LYDDFRNGEAAGGFIDYVRLFSLIGILVLLIACINFMNLSTARSEKRAREVGIRKAIGAQRKELLFQFLIESLLITAVAFVLSLLFTQLALPFFNALTGATISIPYTSPVFWLVMAGYVLFTGLLAGSRPAFHLSRFNPVKVLKGSVHTGRSATLPRKALVVVQFACSVALIISTLVIYLQIQHARNRPKGYDPNRLMMTEVNEELSRNYVALKNELLQSGVVTHVTKSSSPATDIWSTQRIDNWQGKQPGEGLELATVAVSDPDYFSTMGIQLVKGRNFTANLAADSLNVVLNEAAVKRMHFSEPLDQVITWHDVPQRVKVIGVVKDALMISPFTAPEPAIFILDPHWSNFITYRLSPAMGTQEAVTKLTAIFNRYNTASPYQYNFGDESYAAKFRLETLTGRLAGLFATLAVFISCLGLFGLAAYTAEQRTREIGIRKVLGASVSQIWLLLSKDFIVLVLIGSLVAMPVAFYFSEHWLEQYEYRIHIGPGVFIAAALAAIILTLFTISFQAVKAALMDPVKSLRTE
jgi:ABC-type antimicrobial peptide transport system permease subunit